MLAGPRSPAARPARTPGAHDHVARPRLRSRSLGQGLAEFAFILPIFVLILAGTLDLGRLFYAQISLTNAAREGAFQAAQTPGSFQAGQPCDTTANMVVCRVLFETQDSFVEVAPEDVDLSCAPSSCEPALGNTVTVTVEGEFLLLTPVLSSFFGGQQAVTLSGTATAQLETFPASPTTAATPTLSPSPMPSASPSASATSSATATPACVYPPNVINMVPAEADAQIRATQLEPLAYGDLSKGIKNRVREQNPDATQCVAQGSTVEYHYRPD